jgi:hypothetical protein
MDFPFVIKHGWEIPIKFLKLSIGSLDYIGFINGAFSNVFQHAMFDYQRVSIINGWPNAWQDSMRPVNRTARENTWRVKQICSHHTFGAKETCLRSVESC